MSVRTGSPSWFPILISSTPLSNICYFEIEYVNAGNNALMVGITTLANKNKVNSYNSNGSVFMYMITGQQFINSVHFSDTSRAHPGVNDSRLQMRIDLLSNKVEWIQVHPTYYPICAVTIPESISEQDLYPCIEFNPTFNGRIRLM